VGHVELERKRSISKNLNVINYFTRYLRKGLEGDFYIKFLFVLIALWRYGYQFSGSTDSPLDSEGLSGALHNLASVHARHGNHSERFTLHVIKNIATANSIKNYILMCLEILVYFKCGKFKSRETQLISKGKVIKDSKK
jgi:hypothetical protein